MNVFRASSTRRQPQGWCVTGRLISMCVGPMGLPAPRLMSPAPGTCPGTTKFIRGWFTACVALTAGGLMGKTPASVSRTTLDRKLHCMRNNIHMNLFGSFILRALSILIKDALLDRMNSAQSGPHHFQGQHWVSVQTVTGCRVAMVMMQYSVMANNYWLLVEGLYLHSLLVITVFSEKNYFYIYLCIGWGAPLIFVLPWMTVKYLYENEECWERNINMGFWWIIRSPILFAYLINFIIFIRIIKILMSKLKAHQMRYTDYKFRLAKSTLTLIPLLGIHAILFTFVIDESVPKESLLRLIRLFYDLLFSSFQGLLVAILYCFVNKEVQSEMLKKWKRWKLGKDIEEEYRHTHSQTPHAKSGSMVPAMTHECPDTPEPATTASAESQRLVTGLQNGVSRSRGRARLQLASEPQEGASNCSSLTEDICLEERPLNIVTVTFYPAVQSQWRRGRTNTTPTKHPTCTTSKQQWTSC
ncbi:glucagon receptor isoform X2 [Chanodichthys erythropterus]|uniref:glucagon receptor isoform X2 n=1 Tax=Chanodichthys erythropterus TaxID=933992 RepID=UPI00351E4541